MKLQQKRSKDSASCGRVDDQIKEAVDAVKRFSAETVEDRLAAIKPLFTELYLRLKPHIDWKTVDYAVRGDLRRSFGEPLRVDRGGLNTKFFGVQREHMARCWARLLDFGGTLEAVVSFEDLGARRSHPLWGDDFRSGAFGSKRLPR